MRIWCLTSVDTKMRKGVARRARDRKQNILPEIERYERDPLISYHRDGRTHDTRRRNAPGTRNRQNPDKSPELEEKASQNSGKVTMTKEPRIQFNWVTRILPFYLRRPFYIQI